MKKHTKEKSETDEIQVSTDYSKGGKSPYREWVAKVNGNNHDQYERPVANPDVLSEESGLYYQAPCEDERLEVIDRIAKSLSPQQRQILQLCGYEGRTMENCAVMLKISKRKVQLTLEKIRKLALQK